jgi:hypothetical protein
MVNQFTLSDDERRGDLAKQRALRVQRAPNVEGRMDAAPFSDGITMGLQRPLAGAARALDFWNHPDTSMGERYRGAVDAYDEQLANAYEESPIASTVQGAAGSLLMGGPSGSLLKQGGFDAVTGGIQSLASGDSIPEAAKQALINAGLGGILNTAGLGKGKLDERDRLIQEMFQTYGGQ